jgi:hypothetical protein
MIEFLCGHGARLNLADSLGCTAMHHAAIHGHVDVMYDLAGRGAGISIPNNLKYTPLHKAAKHGQLDAVNALDVLGAQLYATTDAGETPLDIALACGRTLVVSFLKEAMERRPVRHFPLLFTETVCQCSMAASPIRPAWVRPPAALAPVRTIFILWCFAPGQCLVSQ